MSCILICPLNWGLGHATRCIPLIKQYIFQGHKVIIGTNGAALALLKNEFPQLVFVNIPFPTIFYSGSSFFILKILLQVPALIMGIIREHFILKQIIKRYKIDLVLSDNRYGLWNKKIKSIFITHQIFIQVPPVLNFAGKLLLFINKWFINKYNECWIPDFEFTPNYSGLLSHNLKLPTNAKYIGILSRFSNRQVNIKPEFDLLIMISGPEPQRTGFENLMAELTKCSDKKIVVLRGLPQTEISKSPFSANITVLNHLKSDQLNDIILKSDKIICRSGYSTIMDLIALNKKAIIVPTPNQTEQEYLAKYLTQQKIFISINQRELIKMTCSMFSEFVFYKLN